MKSAKPMDKKYTKKVAPMKGGKTPMKGKAGVCATCGKAKGGKNGCKC